jgi:hypothetical protein
MDVKLGLSLLLERGGGVLGDRLLRIILGPKREEVTGGWRKLQTEELHNLYSSPELLR